MSQPITITSQTFKKVSNGVTDQVYQDSNGNYIYNFTFSDGTTYSGTDADGKEYLDTKNKLAAYNSPPPSKLPVTPSTINVTTGAGAPGGFSVSSLKNPLTEISNTTSALAAMAAQASQLSSYLSAAKLLGVALPSSVTNSINASMAKLNTLKSAATAKISSIKLHVPNFSVPLVTVPSLPKAPAFPPLPALPKLPTLPSTPSTPSTSIPSLPSTPTAPKLPT
jgi:hypothetical protein